MITIHWFRRDLRLDDNKALIESAKSGYPVKPIFIFDTNIINSLPKNDARISFIYQQLNKLNNQLVKLGSSLAVYKGDPLEIFKEIITENTVAKVTANKDYEPYGNKRDSSIFNLLSTSNFDFQLYKDQVIFEEDEIVKDDGSPYTVFTPYKNKWLSAFSNLKNLSNRNELPIFIKIKQPFPKLEELGFTRSKIEVDNPNINNLDNYGLERDYPSLNSTSKLGPHLRFGTISIRNIIEKLYPHNMPIVSELIWREFFMQILFHYPKVVSENFKNKYDGIKWRNNEDEFKLWTEGKTGYPMVDAGMRELNETGYMHNRVRMITAGFLCKHLLIDWRWGEAYFAQKLLDYELSSNNGNWQWAAGTGCDAAPYFRIFNPHEQLKKFDKSLSYVRKWIPELETTNYPSPIVDHKYARERALTVYKDGIKN